MKKQSLFLFCFFILFSAMTCDKKNPATLELPETDEQEEPITYLPTYRDDVPPPPIRDGRNINVTELDTCQRILWKYLQRMYPINENNFWDYELYAATGEPGQDAGVMTGVGFHDTYGFFFRDTILRAGGYLPPEGMTCAPIDSTFFYDAVGLPTCKSFNKVRKYTSFIYYVKWNWRKGPVPHIYEERPELGYKCDIGHFEFASFLRCKFDWETGELRYIDWH